MSVPHLLPTKSNVSILKPIITIVAQPIHPKENPAQAAQSA